MGVLIVAALLVLAATAVLAALSRALVNVSESQLRRELEERGALDRGEWMLGRLERVEWTVALLRTCGRMGFFALILVMVVGIGSPLTVGGIAEAGGAAILLLWLITGVVAGGFARYAPAEAIAASLPLLRATYLGLYPLVWLAGAAEGLVRRVVRARSPQARQEETLLSSIEDTHRTGAIDRVSAAILENAVQFGDTTVGAVMTPRAGIRGLAYTDDLRAIREFVERAGHSRFPVYEGSMDRIVGVLYVKDLMHLLGAVPEGFVLRPLLRAPVRVPESKPLRDQLIDFQRSKVHFAVVVDEYGGTSGVLTIEDILEELVGEIRDEHEDEDAPPIRAVAPGVFEARGRVEIHHLNEVAGTTVPEDEGYETVAGFLLARLGRIPEIGERLDAEGARFEVVRATPTTVEIVRVTPHRAGTAGGE
jgi:magnesium and cobalt transporter